MNKDYKNALPTGYRLYDYHIESVLGAGSFGITYKALDKGLNQHVAIKEYLPHSCAFREGYSTVAPKATHSKEDYEWGLTRFQDEAQNLAKFKHPNIVRVVRYFPANGTAYLVMEYEEGETLGTYLKRIKRCLSEKEVLNIFKPILEGLHVVHEGGLLHRDIKPDNIFLRTTGSPMLIDFGAARYDLGTKTCTVSEILTPGYAPIEQYSSRGKNQGAWSDIYAIGANIYFCLLRKKPVASFDRFEDIENNEPDPCVKLEKQLEGKYSRVFLKTIDIALEIRARNRPQSVRHLQSLLDMPQSPPPIKEKIKRTKAIKSEGLRKWVIKKIEDYKEKQLVGEMVKITGGCFQMGSSQSEKGRYSNEKQHETSVEDFYIGRYEVTQKLWQAVMGNNPSFFKGKNLPVESVTWNAVQDFIEKLNAKTGQSYCLPTEVQWEYAARAETITTHCWGNTIDYSKANYGYNLKKTTAVGSYDPNAFGLYDMTGNVWEWTCSEYDEAYNGKEKQCLSKNKTKNPYLVIRGGSWFDGPRTIRSANRNSYIASDYDSHLGFRLSRAVKIFKKL